MIKETSIDDVRNADAVQVISHFLPDLKRAGAVYQCKSPFTNEKSASFTVFPRTNTFKCFSGGSGGDAIKFVQLYKRVSFTEAVETIASICNIVLQHEEVSEDVKRKQDYKQELFDLTSLVANKYSGELIKLDDAHWVKKMIAERQINQETIAAFGIGYAPADFKFLTNPIIESAKLELGTTTGLITSKDGKTYDFFRDKLIFPIHDAKGNVVGFGGRRSNEADGPKYINSKDSDVYKKSSVLYGLYQGKAEIAKARTAILVEGYTDVTAMHQNGCEIAVANCGTAAMSPVQCSLLSRIANHIIICRDNDGSELSESGQFQKGIGAMMKDINILLAANFKVSVMILPEGEDPDSFSRKTENAKEYFLNKDNHEDAVIWKTMKLKNRAANDPDAISEMVTEVAEMLFQIKDDVKRGHYLEIVRKLIKQPAKVLKDKIQSFVAVAEKKSEVSGSADNKDAEKMGLPDGADFSMYMTKGFVEHGNSIYFRGRERFFMGTNFRITPLFFVKGQQENKRLCEVTFLNGIKRVIDFDVEDFITMAKFEAKLLKIDSLFFSPDVSVNHFKLYKNSILGNFIIANEVKTLGWTEQGFFAFADCIFKDGVIKRVNNYGIVQLDNLAKPELTEDEKIYFDDVDHYYLPSSSVMYKTALEGDDPYENDRYLTFKKSPIHINTWFKQIGIVYGKKSYSAISFALASLFKDLFMSKLDFFPILFLSGEKGSGKTIFAESVAELFVQNQKGFDLNASTPVAFHRRLSRLKNCPTVLEEFNDNLPSNIKQSIKGSFNGFGREMGKATGDNRTTTTKVNCSLIILSQYLSSWDDNSITSRSVIEHFIKPQEAYTEEQKENYATLKKWQKVGLNSMLCDILIYRQKMEEEVLPTYTKIMNSFIKELKGKDYQERMLQNYALLLTPIAILQELFEFPFAYEDIKEHFKNAILDSSDLIIESEGLAEFWRVLEFLLDTHRIKENKEFKVDVPAEVPVQGRKGEPVIPWKNDDRKRLLFLRLNAVHQLYHKEVSTREGVDVIGENTLKNYFKSKKYFIGSVKSMRFEDTSTSAYVFDYDMMINGGILNLTRKAEGLDDSGTLFEPKQPEDDLPY
jgi:DNA primase